MLEKARLWISKRKPWVFENNILPKLLSKVAPIDVFAFSAGPFVFCREELPDRTRRHETIHYHQQLEMLFVFQWLLYAYYTVAARVKGLSGREAYYANPFELEAYDNDETVDYLENRPMWAWRAYLP